MLLGRPHHDGSPLYVGDAAPSLGDVVPVRVWIPHAPGGGPGARDVVLRTVRDGEPAASAARVERSDQAGTWWRAEVHADNPITCYRFLVIGPGGDSGADSGRDSGGDSAGPYGWLNGTGLHARDVTDTADFRIVTHPAPPDWVLDQVVYQVFPDRYARSVTTARELPGWAVPADWDEPVQHQGRMSARQLYGGDLDGVTEHLDHVAGLGATLLYLTPIFEAESNHRYDAVSFDRVDPLLGGRPALSRLLEAAHRRGIRVIGDLTTNHTGRQHAWFRAALADTDSPEASFYRFRRHPDDYDCWLDHRSLPRLDHSSAELRRRLYSGPDSVLARWLHEGLDGWRIDVANMTGRMGAADLAHEVAGSVRRTAVAANPQAWILAEHGHDASSDLAGDGWHGTMDYSGFLRPVWTWLNGGGPNGPGRRHGLRYLGLPVPVPVLPGTAMVATMQEMHAAMPWRSWAASTSHLDTHDTARFRTVTGGGTGGGIDLSGQGRPGHLAGLALQMTLPGVPAVFMGDELGLTGVDGEHSRTPFPWRSRDGWDAATLAAYRFWIRLRRQHVALRRGGLRWAHVGRDSVTFLREHADERLLVHVSRAAHPPVRLAAFQLGLASGQVPEALAGDVARLDAGTVVLPDDGPAAAVYLLG